MVVLRDGLKIKDDPIEKPGSAADDLEQFSEPAQLAADEKNPDSGGEQMKWSKLIKVAVKKHHEEPHAQFPDHSGHRHRRGRGHRHGVGRAGCFGDIQGQISSLGSDLIIIMPGASEQEHQPRRQQPEHLTMKDVNKIAREGKLIKFISP